jgi:hypothetical protein
MRLKISSTEGIIPRRDEVVAGATDREIRDIFQHELRLVWCKLHSMQTAFYRTPSASPVIAGLYDKVAEGYRRGNREFEASDHLVAQLLLAQRRSRLSRRISITLSS